MEQELKTQEKELTDEINSLGKKVGVTGFTSDFAAEVSIRSQSQNIWKSSLMMPRLNSGTL